MKENMPKIIALIVLITIINCGALIYKTYQNHQDEKIREENRLQKEKNQKEQFAMYIKNDSGNYDKYEGKDFPDGYKVNLEKSSCEDANGNTVSGVISMTNGKPTVTSNKTIYCTFYMDEKTIVDDIMSDPNVDPTEVIEDELAVRYYGSNPNNYICFGTNDKDTCTSNPDTYMYRIIGVTKNSNLFKVIKKTPIKQSGNAVFYWHNTYSADTKWNASDLYKGLNGISGGKYSNLFIGNTTYVPSGWADKIETVSWRYADFTDVNKTAAEIVQLEQASSLPTTSEKIGLMYVADYYYAYQKAGLNCSSSGNYASCKTNSWLHISKAGDINPEWTMSRYGDSGGYYAWVVHSDGSVSAWHLYNTISVRPVFYLDSNVQVSGEGTETDPFIITT